MGIEVKADDGFETGDAVAPSRIADIETVVIRHTLDGTLRNPLFRWSEKITLLVFVRTEDGVIGVGEAWCAAGSPEPIVSFIRNDVRPVLVGADSGLVEAALQRFRRLTRISSRKSETDKALSAIDIALWDIKGKNAGMPVWRLLGGHDRSVAAYASGGLYREGQSAAEFAAEHAGQIDAGFRGIKIKVGGAAVSVDFERVSSLREAVGPDIALMVDGVASLNVPRATALARTLARFDIKWFEQPVVNEDIDGLMRIRRDGGLAIAGNENESGLDAFRRLISSGGVDYVQFDPVVSGGLTEGRKIAALAEAAHLPVTLHHSNSIVSMLANIHLAAALPNCDSIEFHILHRWLFEEYPAEDLRPVGGMVAAPESPGLGIDLAHLAPW
jgi:L-alanine-DL-glutamate epimerase-like enolase superfamily enzyme